MGYIRDHAIVVKCDYGDHIEKAHAEAVRIFAPDIENGGVAPTAITPEAVNGSRSFLVPPDGSKEGWPESDAGDARRAEFIAYLNGTKYEDGSSPLKWVEVRVSDYDHELTIERSHITPDSTEDNA